MKQLLTIVLLAGLLLGGHFTGRGQVFEWAKLARTGRPFTGITSGGTDRQGNTYVTIAFRDTLRVGSQTLLAGAGTGAVVKYDSTGQVLWARQLRGLDFQNNPYSVAVDPTGSGIFLLGQAQAGATWAGAPVAVSTAGSFYAKCSAAGALQWALPLPGVYVNYFAGGLTADGLGNCYVMSNVRQATQLQGVALDTTSSFLMQANPAGAIQWVRTLSTDVPGAGRTRLQNMRLAGHAAGGCTLTAWYNNQVYFDAVAAPVVNTSGAGVRSQTSFIGQVSAAGAMRWAQPAPTRAVGSNAVGVFFGIATDGLGNSYGTGSFGNNMFGLVKFDGAGVQQWVQVGTSSGGFAYGVALTADRVGNTTLAIGGDAQANTFPPLTIGSLVVRRTSLVHFDPQGQPLWAVPYAANSGPVFFLGIAMAGSDDRGNVYYAGNVSSNSLDTLKTRPATVLGTHTVVGRGMILARIGTRHNTVTGALYLDQNGNGRPDAGDVPLAQQGIVTGLQAGNSYFGTLDTDGQYRFYVGPGAYTAVAPVPPLHYALSQPAAGSYGGSFVGYGRVDTARHFGYRPIANQADIRVTLTPYCAARPGFLSIYRLTVENVGTTTVANGTATVTLDGRMAYVSSAPVGTRSGQTVSWTYTNLPPFSRRTFDVSFSLPTNTPLGTALSSTATAPLPTDVVPADNTSTAPQTVTGSFDPNDITVNYQRLTPAQVAAQLPLDYTIRFQNMGTDTAFTVVISDTLNFRKLNVASLMLVAQSHSCIWSLSGTGLLTVRFLNIKLPHRNQDVIRSQGFVRFRVRPKTTLAVGEIIPNHGHIFFDYNAPIRTNTATTAVLLPTAVAAARPGLAWEVYPNPARETVTLAADLTTAGPVRVQVLDALGRACQTADFAAPAGPLRQTLDVRNLRPGLYLLRLQLPDGQTSSRALLRE